MKKPFTSRLLALACAGILSSSIANAATLKEIYQQALDNDHRFKAAQAQLKAGEEFRKIGRSALLPQVGFEASYTQAKRTDNSDQLITQDENGQLLSEPVWAGSDGIDSDSETTEYGVSLNQAFFDMSAWSGYKRGQAASDIAHAAFYDAEQQLILRTANAYFDVLRANDALTTRRAEEAALSHQLEQTKQRFEVGLTAITEVHEAQAAYDSATANRLVAEGALGISFEALEVLTGQTHASLSPLVDGFEAAYPAPMERQEWVDKALENNARLKVEEFTMMQSEEASKESKYEHLPTLYGSVTYGGQNTDDTNGFDPVDNTGTSVRLTLSVPLYSGGRISATRRQSYYNYVAQKELYNQVKREVVQAARSSHLNVITAVANVKARKQAIVSSQSALEATQAGYDVGTRDLVDVLNAQRALYAAQNEYYDALYSYIIRSLELKQAAGTLNPGDIDQLDQWLNKAKSVKYSAS